MPAPTESSSPLTPNTEDQGTTASEMSIKV